MIQPQDFARYVRRFGWHVTYEVAAKFFAFRASCEKDFPPLGSSKLVQWALHSALEHDVTLTFSKLFDFKGACSIGSIVRFAQAEHRKIKWVIPLDLKLIDEHLALLSREEGRINQLRQRRNKFFAHNDRDYFFDPDMINKDYPMSLDDMSELMILAQNIIQPYHVSACGLGLIPFHEYLEREVNEAFVYARTGKRRRRTATMS